MAEERDRMGEKLEAPQVPGRDNYPPPRMSALDLLKPGKKRNVYMALDPPAVKPGETCKVDQHPRK
jgi:hypothetical protein